MTLILELTPDQEERLTAEAVRCGVDAQTYALRRLFSEDETSLSGPTLADRLRALGVVGAIEGTPRPDGRNRSEIEAACDSAH
jgi:hypothetical protein